jgi:hypothetical protein
LSGDSLPSVDNKRLTWRQQKYASLRAKGFSRLECAKAVGYSQTSLCSLRNEQNVKVLAYIEAERQRLKTDNETPSMPTEIMCPGDTYVPRKISLCEPVSRAELLSAMSNIVRNENMALTSRILAAKLMSDLQGWLEPNQRQNDVVIKLGADEEKL